MGMTRDAANVMGKSDCGAGAFLHPEKIVGLLILLQGEGDCAYRVGIHSAGGAGTRILLTEGILRLEFVFTPTAAVAVLHGGSAMNPRPNLIGNKKATQITPFL